MDLVHREIKDLVPFLYKALDLIQAKYNACNSSQQRIDSCLNQALGCLLAMERRIQHAVKLLASKVQDERNNPIFEDPAIYLQWKTPILGHPFFSSPAFRSIVTRVHDGQRSESLVTDEELSKVQSNWVKREISNVLLPKLQRTQRCTQSILQQQRSFRIQQNKLTDDSAVQSAVLLRISCQLSHLSQQLGIEFDDKGVTPVEAPLLSRLSPSTQRPPPSKRALHNTIVDDDSDSLSLSSSVTPPKKKGLIDWWNRNRSAHRMLLLLTIGANGSMVLTVTLHLSPWRGEVPGGALI